MASSNSSAAGGAPATDGFLPHCSPRVFTSPELFAPGEYEAASQEAHRALGFFLLAVLGCWSGLVLEVHPAWTLRRAYLASAATEAAAGCYLLLWVFHLLQPAAPAAALAAFARRSLVQVQHVAISCSLVACGVVDLAHGCSIADDEGGSGGGRSNTSGSSRNSTQ